MVNLDQPCIGILDSGLGGLSVLKEIQKQLPKVPIQFIADQANVPYGQKDLSEIRALTFAITRFLVSIGVRLVVIACNTASAAALKLLRDAFPDVPFVGMEPAVKPAANNTRSGSVGVLATPATFEAEMFQSLVERFAADIQVITNTAPGLVEAVEAGAFDHPDTRSIVAAGIHPMLEQGVDTIVLGCTHFPLVMPLIQEVAGTDIVIIDPAPAVARRVASLMEDLDIQCQTAGSPTQNFATSGDPEHFEVMVQKIMGIETNVQQLAWQNGKLDWKR